MMYNAVFCIMMYDVQSQKVIRKLSKAIDRCKMKLDDFGGCWRALEDAGVYQKTPRDLEGSKKCLKYFK